MNKNKFYFCRIVKSTLFNIQRISVCLMLLNLIYSQTLLDYLLLLIAIFYSQQSSSIFSESNWILPMTYCVYFCFNWMLLRIPKVDWYLYT